MSSSQVQKEREIEECVVLQQLLLTAAVSVVLSLFCCRTAILLLLSGVQSPVLAAACCLAWQCSAAAAASGGEYYRPVTSGLPDITWGSVVKYFSASKCFQSGNIFSQLFSHCSLLSFSDNFSQVLPLTPVLTGVPRAISTYLYSASVLLVLASSDITNVSFNLINPRVQTCY